MFLIFLLQNNHQFFPIWFNDSIACSCHLHSYWLARSLIFHKSAWGRDEISIFFQRREGRHWTEACLLLLSDSSIATWDYVSLLCFQQVNSDCVGIICNDACIRRKQLEIINGLFCGFLTFVWANTHNSYLHLEVPAESSSGDVDSVYDKKRNILPYKKSRPYKLRCKYTDKTISCFCWRQFTRF